MRPGHARLCAAGILWCLLSGVAVAHVTRSASVVTPLSLAPSAVAQSTAVSPEGPAAGPYPTPDTPADVTARARALDRALPAEPGPLPFQIPENADGQFGLHRFALSLIVFSGVIVVGTLAALFLSLLHRGDKDVSSHRPPAPSHH